MITIAPVPIAKTALMAIALFFVRNLRYQGRVANPITMPLIVKTIVRRISPGNGIAIMV